MPVIILTTEIAAPLERCFDLSRSVDLHVAGTSQTRERVVGGVTSGLLGLGDEVTWRARHLGVWQSLTARITEYSRPYYFTDVMVRGTFKSLEHRHIFEFRNGMTVMTDKFAYDVPFGLLGTIVDIVFLRKYLIKFLAEKNRILKQNAESDGWKRYLPAPSGPRPTRVHIDPGQP